MDASNRRRTSKHPGSEKCDDEMDNITSFDDNEKIFHAKMKKLFKKYDRPFLNDVLISLEDLTYDTPEGRHLWNLSEISCMEALSQVKKTPSFKQCKDLSPARKLVPSDPPDASPSQPSKTKRLPTTLDVKQRSDHTCTTLMRYKEDNPYRDDRKSCASRQNSDLSVLSKTLHVELPLKAPVSEEVDTFVYMDNKECCVKSPGRYNVVVCKADDSGPLDNEEASYLDPGNKTLDDMYPQMIESFSRLWDLNIKNQAADNIVRYYKRYLWSKNKKVLGIKMNRHMSQSVNRTFTISSAPVFEEIVSPSKSYNSRMLQEITFSKLDAREPMKGNSPGFSQGQKFGSPVSTVTMHLNPQNYASKAFEGSLDNVSVSLPSPFLARVQKKNNSIIPPETDPFSYCKDSKHLQQSIRRSNSFSDFMSLSPKKAITRPNCYMSERTKSPSKAMTPKSQMDIERNHGSYKEYTKQLQSNRTCTITRRNSFSSFPPSHSPSRNFESLYRNLTPSRTQPDLSSGKSQFQLSKTVYSLVNSPGSRRAKRPASHDFSFPMSKQPRSATEYLFGRSIPIFKSMDSSDVSWVESNSSRLHHSLVASSVETRMLPYSPVSLRSFPRAVNDGCPLRTNARTYRKLSYPENNGR